MVKQKVGGAEEDSMDKTYWGLSYMFVLHVCMIFILQVKQSLEPQNHHPWVLVHKWKNIMSFTYLLGLFKLADEKAALGGQLWSEQGND